MPESAKQSISEVMSIDPDTGRSRDSARSVASSSSSLQADTEAPAAAAPAPAVSNLKVDDERFPRPQHFPSESWPTPPLSQAESSEGRAKLAKELSETPTGSEASFHRLVIATTIKTYAGDYENGLPHGHGRAEFKAGQTYEGNWTQGLMDGQGSYTWTDGSSYTGTMSSHSVTGNGLIVWPDGSTYQGDVVDGYREGKGTFIDPSVPCLYEGEWVKGLRHGTGKITYDDAASSFYEGQWFEGARHGYGVLRYKSGNLYEGQWVWDRKVGRGVMNWYTVNQRYNGEWLNDRPHGQGEYTWLDLPVSGVKALESTRSPFASSFPQKNQISAVVTTSAQLVTHFQHHNRYIGNFNQGVREGLGLFHYSNGSIYQGEWKNDRKDGQGSFTFANGSTYQGQFENDQMKDEKKWQHPYTGVAEVIDSMPASPPPGTGKSNSSRLGTGSKEAAGRTAKALEAATTASQKDVGMFDLPLNDLLLSHAQNLGLTRGSSTTDQFVENQRDLLTNLLLRYNTELLDIYRYYSQADVDLSHPEYSAPVLPVDVTSPLGAPVGAQHLSADASKVSARMNLGQMWLLLNDLGIIGHSHCPDLTIASLNRLILPISAEIANRKLLPDLKRLHDPRQVFLLRDFAYALIRIAEVVYENEMFSENEGAENETTVVSPPAAVLSPGSSTSVLSPSKHEGIHSPIEEGSEEELKDDEGHGFLQNQFAAQSEEEIESEDPNVLYTRAQEHFNELLGIVPPATPAFVPLAANELALPLAGLSTSTSASTPASASPNLSPSASSRGLKPHSRQHSRAPSRTASARSLSGASTPAASGRRSVVMSSTARSGTVAAQQLIDGKSVPFSSSSVSNVSSNANPASLTAKALSKTIGFQFGVSQTVQLHAISVRFKRFLLEFLLPRAKTRSKHAFGAGAASHRENTNPTTLPAVFRIAPLQGLVRHYARTIYPQVFLQISSVVPATITGRDANLHKAALQEGGAVTTEPLVDRTTTVGALLSYLQSHSTCFNSYFTFYHALDALFGLQNHAHERLDQSLQRELIWEEVCEVLVRLGMYRGKILQEVSESLLAERAAQSERDTKRREEREALEKKQAEEAAAAAAAASQAAQEEESSGSKKGGKGAKTPLAFGSSTPKSPNPGTKTVGSPSASKKKDKDDAKTPGSPIAVKKKDATLSVTASPTESPVVTTPVTPAVIPSTPVVPAVPIVPVAEILPSVTLSPRQSNRSSFNEGASPVHSARGFHSHHVSLGGESGSFRKKDLLSPSLEDNGSASPFQTPSFHAQPSPIAALIESHTERWVADTESFFCTLLNQELPQERAEIHRQNSQSIKMLMI